MSNKKKTVEQIVKLSVKQWRSWFNNSNSSRPVKLWLDEYLNQLDKAELYSLISDLCNKIYTLNEMKENKAQDFDYKHIPAKKQAEIFCKAREAAKNSAEMLSLEQVSKKFGYKGDEAKLFLLTYDDIIGE